MHANLVQPPVHGRAWPSIHASHRGGPHRENVGGRGAPAREAIIVRTSVMRNRLWLFNAVYCGFSLFLMAVPRCYFAGAVIEKQGFLPERSASPLFTIV